MSWRMVMVDLLLVAKSGRYVATVASREIIPCWSTHLGKTYTWTNPAKLVEGDCGSHQLCERCEIVYAIVGHVDLLVHRKLGPVGIGIK